MVRLVAATFNQIDNKMLNGYILYWGTDHFKKKKKTNVVIYTIGIISITQH